MKILLLILLLLLTKCVKTESQVTKEKNEHASKCYLAAILISQQNQPNLNNVPLSEYNKYFSQIFDELVKDLTLGYACAEILKPKNKNTLIIPSGGEE